MNIRCLLLVAVSMVFSAGIAGPFQGCGGDGDSLPTCTTQADEFSICDHDKVYRCPIGDGSKADMELVTDCGATGDICVHDLVAGTASCKDPNHIVGDDAATYSEQDDVANNDEEGAENTGYLLDEAGLVISGSLGPGDVDHFIFQAGYSPHFDMQILRDGEKASGTLTVHPTSSAAIVVMTENGSIVNGSGNMWPAGDYLVKIENAGEGTYTLEIKEH